MGERRGSFHLQLPCFPSQVFQQGETLLDTLHCPLSDYAQPAATTYRSPQLLDCKYRCSPNLTLSLLAMVHYVKIHFCAHDSLKQFCSSTALLQTRPTTSARSYINSLQLGLF